MVKSTVLGKHFLVYPDKVQRYIKILISFKSKFTFIRQIYGTFLTLLQQPALSFGMLNDNNTDKDRQAEKHNDGSRSTER